MFLFLWSFLMSAWSQDLMLSLKEPKELLSAHEQEQSDINYIESMLKRYAKGAKYVVIGEVLDVRNLQSNLGYDREAQLMVDSWVRGEGENSISIFVPHNAPFLEGDWSSVPGKVVQGYSVVVFLDNQLRVVEGNAIFYTDGENLWRNKRPTLFLHPGYDREWEKQNPYEDYIVFPFSRVQYWINKQKLASWMR